MVPSKKFYMHKIKHTFELLLRVGIILINMGYKNCTSDMIPDSTYWSG